MIRMTYKKKNGEIVQRISLCTQYKIGDKNSWGWLVINKEYWYNNGYHVLEEYDRLREKDWKKDKQIRNIKKFISNMYKTISNYVVLVIVVKAVIDTIYN